MAGSRVEKLSQATRDLSDIAVYLAEESGNEELASRFLEAAEAAFEQLAAMPEMGARRRYRREPLQILRMWRIADFPNHLIFYRPLEDGVEIVRVLHAKRDIAALFSEEDF